MSRACSDDVGEGWRIAAVIEGRRREGVVVRHSGETVKFRDRAGEACRVARPHRGDRPSAREPPGA